MSEDTEVTTAQGCVAMLAFAVGIYAVLTPLILLAWNVGLEPAGITNNTIGWATAAGLTTCVLVLRFVVGAARPR